jgi:glycogen(starch) synthase
MRILVWCDGFWPRVGGVETYALRFAVGLQERGHSCLVLAEKDHPSWKEDEIYKGVTIKRFDFNAILENRELKRIGPIEEYLERVAQEFKPDAIFLNTYFGGSAFMFLLFRKLFSAPVISIVQSYFNWDAPPATFKQIFSEVDHVSCISNSVLETIKKDLPPMKNRPRVIYSGLPMPEIAPTPLPFSPPTILFLGRLFSEKGGDTAVEAFSLLKKKAQLLIAGVGPERPRLEQLVDKLHLRRSTEFIGKVRLEEVPSIINRATLVVVPSHFEPLGLVALESMQMQRPVIASNCGGLAEVVSDRVTGLLVPPKDPVALFRAMQDLLDQPKKAIEMGIQGRLRANEKFSLDENLNQYEELLHAIGLGYFSRL